jgi:hypothetical protein
MNHDGPTSIVVRAPTGTMIMADAPIRASDGSDCNMVHALLRSSNECPIPLRATGTVCLGDIAGIVNALGGEMVSRVRSQAGQDDGVDIRTPANTWVDRSRAPRVAR